MHIDDSAAVAAEAELDVVLASVPPHAVDHFADILDVFAEKAEQLFVIECEHVPATGGTRKGVVFLKPSALFEELMSALRIRTSQLDVGV